MNPEKRAKAIAWARRLAIPVGMLVAFLLGGLFLGGESESSEGDPHADHKDVELWTCSMHPQVRAPESGQCPICGMDLIPVEGDNGGSSDSPERIGLSEGAKIRARIRTAPVRRLSSGSVERRLLGRVDYDETRLRTVTSWIGGRIDRLQVKTTGQRVRRGQVIATLYSPEVFSAHQDLLVAKQQAAKLAGATEGAQMGARAALDASRDRLRLLGVPAREIATMEKAQRPSEQVRIRSPFSGTVIERLATEGNYVKTGTGLYQIADLSRLWVQLDAYESDLPLLKTGQEVSLKVEALPAEEFAGRVTFVDPVLNQRTRTTRVRIEVKNAKGQLRPGMFAEAVVRSQQGEAHASALVIPDTAPLFTGRRSIVYVEVPKTERPTYEARVVRLGPKMGEVYPVIAGLSEGEAVVINGAFTLDADLQIRGGLSMMVAPDDLAEGPYDQIVEVPKKHKDGLSGILTHYLALHEALASDKLDAAKKASASLAASADKIKPKSPAEFVSAWSPLQRQLITHAKHLGHAKSLDEARPVFRDISQQIATLLRVFGNATKETVRLASCPMALEGEGAEWVQRASVIENPYFGASMHSCGEVHDVVEHGTYLPLRGGKPAPPPKAPAGGHQH
ncbi:MAG: efflux RND transporter periplasmic adaptor subunit [Deltaproteobacteria bacterium]|nr:efflux RND transporter periplasmic adaptor subunit [Deltaproteobacteria bacterium]